MMNEMDEQEFKQYCESVLSGRDPLSSLRAARFGLSIATIIDSLRSQLASTQAELKAAREGKHDLKKLWFDYVNPDNAQVKGQLFRAIDKILFPETYEAACTGYKAKENK